MNGALVPAWARGYTVEPNRDLVGLGAANLLAGLFVGASQTAAAGARLGHQRLGSRRPPP